jgi:hypothetical protein
VPSTGLEPVAYRLGGGRSIHLSYEGACSTVAPCRSLAATWPIDLDDRDRFRTAAQDGAAKTQVAFEDGYAGRIARVRDQLGAAVGRVSQAVETIEAPLEKSDIRSSPGRWRGARSADHESTSGGELWRAKPGDDP